MFLLPNLRFGHPEGKIKLDHVIAGLERVEQNPLPRFPLDQFLLYTSPLRCLPSSLPAVKRGIRHRPQSSRWEQGAYVPSSVVELSRLECARTRLRCYTFRIQE